MSAERIAELQRSIAGRLVELGSIGFSAAPIETAEKADIAKAEQFAVGNRIQKLNVLLAAERDELKRLTGCDETSPEERLFMLVMHMGRMSEADKVTQGRTSYRAWKTLCKEVAEGRL